MGPHALENETAIFARKRADIELTGKTLWLCQSPAARPDRLRMFVNEPCRVFFLAPATKNGARPTTSAHRMTEFSLDKHDWSPISAEIGPVTGQARDGAYALVLSSLEMNVVSPLDLWSFVDLDGAPIRFRLGASTLLARQGDTSAHPLRTKSRMRRILATGWLTAPYAVWVR